MSLAFQEGQRVRVFGILSNSWVLGEVIKVESEHVTVLVKDWFGLPRSAHYTLPSTQIEPVLSGPAV